MTDAAVEYRFERFEFRPALRQLLVDGQPAAIGARAFDLLLVLVERRQRVVSKNELLELVWPGLVVEENNLQVQVSTLRKLLGPAMIATVPGRGYRFTASLDGAVKAQAAAPPAVAPLPASPTAVPGNLPRQLPPLIGREDDLRALVDLIEGHRLITVVGAGGVGKTTLALAAAHALRERWGDGAWMVELAHVTDPGQVPQAVAYALRIGLSGSGAPQDQLAAVLQSQTLLIVLDNCEQVVKAVGALADAIVARAPGVRLLATSQELLNVARERLFKLNPLAVPAADEPANAQQFGALRLFAERAQAADPHFTLSAANADAVAEICRRLDGLPLAIEMAAARVRLLGVQGVRDRLGERFRMLTGGARTALPRHQTLHAAIDWSYGLLPSEEKAMLRQLAGFVGGFTLELAQQIAGDERIDEWAVLDALGGLIDKSLVAVDNAEPPRYRLLETTRAYALQKLAEAGEAACLVERHARAVCNLFLQTEEARFGDRGTLDLRAYMHRLAPELDNVRAALDWAMGDAGNVSTAIALTGASAEVFRTIGLSREALRFVQALQDGVDGLADPEHAALFWLRMLMLGEDGRLPKAIMMEAAARSEKIYRRLGSRRRLHFILYMKGWTLSNFDDQVEAETVLPELLALEDPAWPGWVRSLRLHLHVKIFNREGRFQDSLLLLADQRALLEREPGEEARLVQCLTQLCMTLSGLQRDEEVVALARSTIERSRRDGMASVSRALAWLMASLTFLGRFDEADQTMRKAMTGWRRDGLLFFFGGVVALLLAEQGRYADAVRVDGAALAFIHHGGIADLPVLRRARGLLQQRIETARLKPADIERWRSEGERLDEAALAAVCLGGDRA